MYTGGLSPSNTLRSCRRDIATTRLGLSTSLRWSSSFHQSFLAVRHFEHQYMLGFSLSLYQSSSPCATFRTPIIHPSLQSSLSSIPTYQFNMDRIFLIKDRRPPVHFPPPTRRTALTDELRATTTSAAQKGLTDTTSPTSTNVSLSETDAKNVYPVRYFRSFDLDNDDVRAVWPATLINTDNASRKQKASMTRYKSKIQNAVLSVGGPMSRDRWLLRMVIVFVSIYDYKVHLHNIQVAILRARIVPTTESDD